jgi:hypothetical protein
MAEYLVLIYGDDAAIDDASPAERGKMMEGHRIFGEKHGASLRGGNALQASSTATTIRSDGVGGFTITDGAFAETKEALGGYYLLEAAHLDEAIAMAKEIPAPNGGVEVRPIRPLD